jgi:putative addiction module component (TIGR02574 family)
MPDFHAVLTEASQLSVDDRLKLIEALASSVPDDRPPALSQEWLTELQRRSSEIDSGAVPTESWQSIRDRLFGKYGIRDAN